MDTPRDLFLKYDYLEAKDLCKQFLTLNASVLVVSVTFSEKVANFASAPYESKVLLLSSWSCLLASLIGCGLSLAYMSLAAGRVVYHERTDYLHISERTLIGICISGGIFVVGLIFLSFAAAVTVWGR
jgi:hypothetical protein